MSLDSVVGGWQALMLQALCEGTFVFGVVLAVWWPLRRRAPAQLGSGLFLLVPLKLLLPFEIAMPAAVAAAFPASWWRSAAEVAPSAARAPVVFDFTAAAPAPSFDLGGWLFAGYVLIVILLSARFLQAQAGAVRLVRRARPLRHGELGLDPEALRHRAGVRLPVRWLVSDTIQSPAAGGLLRPYVLLPAGLLPRLGGRPLAWILLHELAHIRRGDVAVTLLQRFVQIVFFFHPIVWIANRIVDEQREFACDAEALALSGAGRPECGEGFLSVVEWASGHGLSSAAALAMFDSKSVIKRRLVRIMQHPQHNRFGKLLSGAVVVAVASLLLPTVKASPTVGATSSAQDPGELRKLQREIDRLEKAQAELRRKLEAIRKGDLAEAESVDETIEEVDADDDAHEHEVVEIGDGGRFTVKSGKGGVRWIAKDGKAFGVSGGSGDGPGVWVSKDGKLSRLKTSGKGVFVLGEGAGGEAKTFTVRGGDGTYLIERKDGDGRVLVAPGGELRFEKIGDDGGEHTFKWDVKVDDGDGGKVFFDGGKGHVIELKGGKAGRVIELQDGDGKAHVIRLSPKLEGDHLKIEVEGDVEKPTKGEWLDRTGNKVKKKVKSGKATSKNRIM